MKSTHQFANEMDSDQLSKDSLFSWVYDHLRISTDPVNDKKSLDEFQSKLRLLTCDIIQNKVVAGLTLLQHAAKEGLSGYAKLITDSHIDPNVVCHENGKSALAMAAEFGHWKVIEIFINYNKKFIGQFQTWKYPKEMPSFSPSPIEHPLKIFYFSLVTNLA